MMDLYIVLLTLIFPMHVSIAAAEFHKESVPLCGEAFLVTDHIKYYYLANLAYKYEAIKHQSSEAVEKAINKINKAREETIGYFKKCVSKKYDKKDEENLKKYEKCRHTLTTGLEVTLVSKTLADYLDDTTTGLKKTLTAIWDQVHHPTKNSIHPSTKEAEHYTKCLKS